LDSARICDPVPSLDVSFSSSKLSANSASRPRPSRRLVMSNPSVDRVNVVNGFPPTIIAEVSLGSASVPPVQYGGILPLNGEFGQERVAFNDCERVPQFSRETQPLRAGGLTVL
jgi:hypothetical protein